MPCDSSYLEQTERESELQRAANLYVYVLVEFGKRVPLWVTRDADNCYLASDKALKALCKILTGMPVARRNKIIYKPKDSTARDLADWWEEHQIADIARESAEKELKTKKELIKSALAKLTPEERNALKL